MTVNIGIDPHKATHMAVAIDGEDRTGGPVDPRIRLGSERLAGEGVADT